MIDYIKAEQALQIALAFVKTAIIRELIAQGHVASGKLINGIEIRIERTSTGLKGGIYLEDYAFILDKGVSPGRVPYRRGSGAKTSKYIDALVDWIKIIKPGMGEKERKSFAFAIANKAKQEGHPTRGSYSFSRNGRRKEWAKYAIDENLKRTEALLDLSDFVAASIDNFVTDLQRLV